VPSARMRRPRSLQAMRSATEEGSAAEDTSAAESAGFGLRQG
jgi:hypothetical protein